jgi:hypothetical protein
VSCLRHRLRRLVLGCTVAFALNHLWSYRYNTQLARQGTPAIGTLMFTPYLRVLPMHFTSSSAC